MTSSSSTPAFTSESWSYDVFLSFRGEDTRKTFVDHLYTSLVQQGIYTYKDDETLPRGELIGPTLLKSIRESRIALIVFSENYADSCWCLDELEYIMKCMDETGQIVLPIFYHVDPSEVRKQKGKYGDALAKHELQKNNKVEAWRKALTDAGNLSGWVPVDIANGHESKVIKEITNTIVSRLANLIPYDSEDLVGVRTRLQDLISKLEIEEDDVRMCGIWGVGGGGKTTLASSLYDKITRSYDGCSFVENIREKSSKDGLESLQEKILKDILKQEQLKVGRVVEGRRMIKCRLCHKKVLIVLDDVNHVEHLNALAGSHDWFGKGSRIIITTRDEHLLNVHKVDMIHNIRLLDDDEAIKLFNKHASYDNIRSTMKDIKLLSKEVISYARGLPLALKVLGSFLCDKDINEWRSAVARLKEIPDPDIVEILKISYDGLKPIEKGLFLDIACFFRGYSERDAMEILDACGFYPAIGIKVLIQKALITVIVGVFSMHDLVQEMGQYIVRGEHPKNPENHTRVWHKEDVLKICAMDASATMGLDKIQAIGYYCGRDDPRPPQRLLEVVANMKKLRCIYLYFNQGFEVALPLPENFPPTELCYLELGGIWNLNKVWKGYKSLPNLKVIKLMDLKDLTETPDFSGLPNLEKLILINSPKLLEFHPSIGHLERLVCLVVKCCYNLEMFPSITPRMSKLKTFELSWCPRVFKPHSTKTINKYNGLRKLTLSGCNLGDEQMDVVFWDLPELQELDLSSNSFSRSPCSLLQLPKIKWLNVSECENLLELSGLPPRIEVFAADDCDLLESVGDISNCKWLWKVSLMGQNNLDAGGGEMVLRSMLEGNAIEHHHYISFTHSYEISMGIKARFDNMKERFTMQLPVNWDNDFCGFLIHAFSVEDIFRLRIFIKHEAYEGLISEIFEEPDEEPDEEPNEEPDEESDEESDEVSLESDEESYKICKFVGYVPFSSLRCATWLKGSNKITFSLDTDYKRTPGRLFGVELIPRKSKGDPIGTTTYCSEFYDEESSDIDTYEIENDSNSSLVITWYPNDSC